MKTIWTLVMAFAASCCMAQTVVVDFEDNSLPGPNTAYYGQDNAGGFTSRGVVFNNQFTDFGGGFFGWEGFAYSNVVDTTTAGFTNQFAAYHLPGGGGDASSIYGVCFNYNYVGSNVVPGFARITLQPGSLLQSIRLTNTTYTALSILQGDSFAKRFGGATGDDPDFLLLLIQGKDASDNITGTVPFYLADYRFSDNALDYIINQWTTVDLSSLPGNTASLTFQITSSDVGPFGINTPAYFALDNLVVAVPEPTSWIMLIGIIGLATGYKCYNRFTAKMKKLI